MKKFLINYNSEAYKKYFEDPFLDLSKNSKRYKSLEELNDKGCFDGLCFTFEKDGWYYPIRSWNIMGGNPYNMDELRYASIKAEELML